MHNDIIKHNKRKNQSKNKLKSNALAHMQSKRTIFVNEIRFKMM